MKAEIVYIVHNQYYPKDIFLQEKESVPFLLYVNRTDSIKSIFDGKLDCELNEGDLYFINETESKPVTLKVLGNNNDISYFLESSTVHDMDSLKVAVSHFEENFDENNEYHQQIRETIDKFMKDK